MKKLNQLNRSELLALAVSYNNYIQYNAEENEDFGNGWSPVSMEEYFNNDFQEERLANGETDPLEDEVFVLITREDIHNVFEPSHQMSAQIFFSKEEAESAFEVNRDTLAAEIQSEDESLEYENIVNEDSQTKGFYTVANEHSCDYYYGKLVKTVIKY